MAAAPRKIRKQAVDAVKRDIIKSAAKKLFAETGLDGTSVREIARHAGYTTGAIYFHYADKEELYADILRDSLDALLARISTSIGATEHPISALSSAFRSFVAFYDEYPSDLDLSLYLLSGAKRRGLTPTLNRELNGKVLSVLNLFRHQLVRAGVKEERLNVEVAGLFDEMIGALVAAHTGRLKVIGADLTDVVEHHTANLVARLSGPKRWP
ncbi:AcrR family transcriptional regulator [Bradyrhizobium japonicum]